MVLHDGLRDLEATWQAEDEASPPPDGGWAVHRDRLRRSTRQVVLYALVVGDVSHDEVARVARTLQAQGLSDPLAEELQQRGLAQLARDFRDRVLGGVDAGGEGISG